MRIFVTGREGQLARCLAEKAQSAPDYEMIFAGRPGFDLTQPEAAKAQVLAAKPDLIVNAAAYTAVDKAEAEPDVAFAIVYATSKPERLERYDLGPARQLLGYEPQETWPQGIEAVTGRK